MAKTWCEKIRQKKVKYRRRTLTSRTTSQWGTTVPRCLREKTREADAARFIAAFPRAPLLSLSFAL